MQAQEARSSVAIADSARAGWVWRRPGAAPRRSRGRFAHHWLRPHRCAPGWGNRLGLRLGPGKEPDFPRSSPSWARVMGDPRRGADPALALDDLIELRFRGVRIAIGTAQVTVANACRTPLHAAERHDGGNAAGVQPTSEAVASARVDIGRDEDRQCG